MDSVKERCPWCGASVSRDRFNEIEAKIRAEEQKRLSKAEAAMRERLEAEKLKAEERIKGEADKRVESMVAERDRTLKKMRELEAAQARIRIEAEKEAERKAKGLLEKAEQQREKEFAKLRQALERDRDHAMLKLQAEFTREREAYQKKIGDMSRQLQRKTAHERGEGAEIDLFEALREMFPGDRITRTQKGQNGADILQEVFYKGDVCGRIIIDSKNRQAWQNAFVTKLHEDQVGTKADHAILSTTVFPRGKKEFCIEGDVIVISPARVTHIVELLRCALIKMHALGLSMKERAGKVNALYRFISSDAYWQRLREASKLTDDILEVDVQEEKEHQKVWKKRGRLATQLRNVLRDIDVEVSAILESSDGLQPRPKQRPDDLLDSQRLANLKTSRRIS